MTKKLLLLFLTTSLVFTGIFAEPPSHDPSRIIKNTDGRYWIFTTGKGIWSMSASNTDFTDWKSEKTPFGSSWPSWIAKYVTGFGGNFWAPDVIKMRDSFYLYYSCAGTGAPATIGVITASNLSGPWTDKGMLVASNNAIDPTILREDSTMWMAWGNWQTGIDIAQLDTLTGLRKNNLLTHLVSGQVEGPGLLKNGKYYYLFFQRGLCCQGLKSTYYMVVARSEKVTGPYIGERIFLPNKTGRIVGPGHFNYNEGKLNFHFYDGTDNGAAKLAITTLSFVDDWPVAGPIKDAYTGITIINNVFSKEIEVYPNPGNRQFSIDLNNNEIKGNVSVCIIDMQGRKVYNKIFNTFDGLLIIEPQLYSGNYLLNIQHSKGKLVKKILIK